MGIKTAVVLMVISILCSMPICRSFAAGPVSETVSADDQHAFTVDVSGGIPDYLGRRYAVAVYHPYYTVCSLMDKSLFFSGEAEYNISPSMSVAAEIRYFDIRKANENVYYSEPSRNLFTVGPGIRLYPMAQGMQGLFAAGYWQLLMGTTSKGIYNPLAEINLTGWIGYRLGFGAGYIEVSGGILFARMPFPMAAFGIGLWL
jgi:hypothetical protein